MTGVQTCALPISNALDDDDASFVVPLRDGWVDRNDDSPASRNRWAVLKPVGLEQAFHRREQLALKFLPTEPRAAERAHHLSKELVGKVKGVVERRPSCDHDATAGLVGLSDQSFHDLNSLRRCGEEQLWEVAESEVELQLIQCLLSARPGCELVAPCLVMLRPAEPLGLFGGVEKGLGAAGLVKVNAAQRRAEPWAQMLGVCGEDAGLTQDHDVAGIGGRRANEGDATSNPAIVPLLDGVGAGVRLAPAAARVGDPRAPAARWKLLLWSALLSPIEERRASYRARDSL